MNNDINLTTGNNKLATALCPEGLDVNTWVNNLLQTALEYKMFCASTEAA